MGTMTAGGRHATLLGLQTNAGGQSAVVSYLHQTLEQAERELGQYEDQYKETLRQHIILTVVETLGADMREITNDRKLRLNGRHLLLYAGALQLPELPGDREDMPAAIEAVETWAIRMAEGAFDPIAHGPDDFDRLQAIRSTIFGDRPAPGTYTDIPDSALLERLSWRGYTIRRLINMPEGSGWGAEFATGEAAARAKGFSPMFSGWPFWILLAKIAGEYRTQKEAQPS